MLGPGTDTTSASLAHMLWALAHNSGYQDELYGDLAAAGFPQNMSGGGGLDAVPKLKACVKEGVRWAGAAAAMLPRVVPEGGVEVVGGGRGWLPGGVRTMDDEPSVPGILSTAALTLCESYLDDLELVAHLVPEGQDGVSEPGRVRSVPVAERRRAAAERRARAAR